jgi:hypothetical protein
MKKNLRSPLAFILTSIVIVLTFTACKSMKTEEQGVSGKVTWLEGNQMPTIKSEDQKSNTSERTKGKPVVRVIKVYPIVNMADARLEDGLFQSIAGDPFAEVTSDENGDYSLILPPGKYSLFTVEEDGLFANSFDGNGNIEPLIVKKGEWVTRDLVINYKAYF